MSSNRAQAMAKGLHRHPESAPGDFYVEHNQCLSCGMPHVVAPDLVGWTDDKMSHCIWKKQPTTPKEVERAIAVLETQDLDCHRYGGTDPAILARLPSRICDCPDDATANEQTSVDSTPVDPPNFARLIRPGFFARLFKKFVSR